MLKPILNQTSRIGKARESILQRRAVLKCVSFLLSALASTLLSACYESYPLNNINEEAPTATPGYAGTSGTGAESMSSDRDLSDAERLGYPLGTTLALSTNKFDCKPSRNSESQADPFGLVISNLRCSDEYLSRKPLDCYFTIENRGSVASESFSAQLLLRHAGESDAEIGNCNIPAIEAGGKQELNCNIPVAPSVFAYNHNFYYWQLTHPNLYQRASSNFSEVSLVNSSEKSRFLISGGNCTTTSLSSLNDYYETQCHFLVSNNGGTATSARILFLINQNLLNSSPLGLFDCHTPVIPAGEAVELDCFAKHSVEPNVPIKISAIARADYSDELIFNWQQLLIVTDGIIERDIPILMDCPKGSYLAEDITECAISFINASQTTMSAEIIPLSVMFRTHEIISARHLPAINFTCALPKRDPGETVIARCQGTLTSEDSNPEMDFDIYGGFDRYCITPQDFGLKLLAAELFNDYQGQKLYIKNISKEASDANAYLWLRELNGQPSQSKLTIPPIAPGEIQEIEIKEFYAHRAQLGRFAVGQSQLFFIEIP